MPIGIIINALCIFVGGFIGLFARNFISERIITNLNMLFGLCSMGMGISSIVLMENMPAVIFALILWTGIGLAIHLGDKIRAGALMMESNKLSNSGYDSCYDPDHAFQLDLEQLYPSAGVLSQQNPPEYDCSDAPEFDTINPYGTLHVISYKFINEWIRGI